MSVESEMPLQEVICVPEFLEIAGKVVLQDLSWTVCTLLWLTAQNTVQLSNGFVVYLVTDPEPWLFVFCHIFTKNAKEVRNN